MPQPISSCTIVTTSRCNQRCTYCRAGGRPAASVSWAAVRPAIESLALSPSRWRRLAFTGGEPLLERRLVVRAVRYLERLTPRSGPVRVQLLTNGLLLDARLVAWFARHSVAVQISLDGGPEAQARRSPGSFDRLDRVIRTMARRHPEYLRDYVSVAVTLVPETIPFLSASLSYLIEAGVQTIRVGPAMDARSDTRLLPLLAEQVRDVAARSLAHWNRTERVPVVLLRRTPFSTPRNRAGWWCGAPLGRSMALDADGSRTSCLLATATYSGRRHLQPVLRQAVRALRLDPADGSPDDQRRAVTRRAAEVGVFAADAPRHSDWGECRDCRWERECHVCPLMTEGEVDGRGSLKIPALACAFNQVTAKYRAQFPLMPPPPW